MGRPVNKRFFGVEQTIKINGVKFADGEVFTDAYIVAQKGTNKFIVQDIGMTHEPEAVLLVGKTSTGDLALGECFIAVDVNNDTVPVTKIGGSRFSFESANGSQQSAVWNPRSGSSVPLRGEEPGGGGGGDGTIALSMFHYSDSNFAGFYFSDVYPTITGSQVDFGQGDVITMVEEDYVDSYVRAYVQGQEYTITFTEYEDGSPTGRGGSITFTAFENMDDNGAAADGGIGAAFVATSVGGFTTEAIQFTNTSALPGIAITSTAWNFGDSTTSTAANPQKTYTTPGTYTVTLTVNGTCRT